MLFRSQFDDSCGMLSILHRSETVVTLPLTGLADFKALESFGGEIARRIGVPLVRFNGREHPAREHLRQLWGGQVFVIAAIEGEGLDPETITPERLFTQIKQAVDDADSRREFHAFVYTRQGKRILPFFSSEERARTFCEWYSMERNRVLPIQVLGIRGSLLASLAVSGELLVLNDRCTDEYVLSEGDMAECSRLN